MAVPWVQWNRLAVAARSTAEKLRGMMLCSMSDAWDGPRKAGSAVSIVHTLSQTPLILISCKSYTSLGCLYQLPHVPPLLRVNLSIAEVGPGALGARCPPSSSMPPILKSSKLRDGVTKRYWLPLAELGVLGRLAGLMCFSAGVPWCPSPPPTMAPSS